MMNNIQTSEAMKNLKEWNLVGSFSVGGFDYMGFSESDSNKLIIISSQRETIFDCKDESITDIKAVFDETEFVAVTDALPDEYILIAGACGFSNDGNSFALVDDGGICILRRKNC